MLTATPSQPEVLTAWVGPYFKSFTPKFGEHKTNAFKLNGRLLEGVRGKERVCCVLMAVVFSIGSPVANADSVISTEQVEILEAGVFDDPTEWDFASNRGFSFDQADYTMGMVADGEMSFTHMSRIISKIILHGPAPDVQLAMRHSESQMGYIRGPRARTSL